MGTCPSTRFRRRCSARRSAAWGLVALHHFGEPDTKQPAYNQGVPIDAIRDRLARVGKADALGDELP